MEIPIFDPEKANQVEALHNYTYQDFLVKNGLIELSSKIQADTARKLVRRIGLSPTERIIASMLCDHFGYLIPNVDVINRVWIENKFVFVLDPSKDQGNQTQDTLLWESINANLGTCVWNINKSLKENLAPFSLSRWTFQTAIGIEHLELRPINQVLLYYLYQSGQSPLSYQDLYSRIYGKSYDVNPKKSSRLIHTSIFEIRDKLKKLNSSIKIGKSENGYYLEKITSSLSDLYFPGV